MAIVASAGGNDQHSAWFRNIESDPTVTVRTDSGSRSMTAREIPVVILEPAD